MAILYTNPKGINITRHSYSAGSDFSKCRRYYKLKRVDGWREKKRKAAMDFGTCLETAIRFFHANKGEPGSTAAEFLRTWAAFKDLPELDFGDDFTWEDLNQIGQEMGRLYEAVLPSLPFRDPRFQLEYKKELFPGSYLAGLEDLAYVDMLAQLNNAPDPVSGLVTTRPIIIDIKTSGASYNATPGIHKLDPQLRRYAWLSGIHDVAFLTFVKTSLGVKKGDIITLLAPVVNPGFTFLPGSKLVVLSTKFNDSIPPHVHCLTPENYADYKEQSKDLKGKLADAVAGKFGIERGIAVPATDLTKQKLQYLPAYITSESMKEMGEMVGEQLARIVDAGQRNYYPQDGGTRFPTAQCTFCPMRGICLGDDKLRDELVVCPGAVRKTDDKDWLDDLGEED